MLDSPKRIYKIEMDGERGSGRLKRNGLKVNVGKSKVMVLNGEKGLVFEVHVGACL